jgi:thiamine-monophosphate kinase
MIHRLHAENLIVCAMDTSDGLAPTLAELARTNGIGLRISLDSMTSSHRGLAERPERFWMGWGDWTVAVVVRPVNVTEVHAQLRKMNILGTTIGEFIDDKSGAVILESTSGKLALARLESERFARDSWFGKGVDEYRRLLHEFPLPDL